MITLLKNAQIYTSQLFGRRCYLFHGLDAVIPSSSLTLSSDLTNRHTYQSSYSGERS